MPVSRTNVIEWPTLSLNDNPYARALREEMMLYAYPYDDIRWGSQLIVNEYENAIFMKDGKVYDVFQPGRYIISTQNIPLLTGVYNLLGGYGETPFKAKVVFVSLKQFKSKFSTKTMVKLGPKINFPTDLNISGEYWYRIIDPVLLLTQVAGSSATLSSPELNSFIRSFFTEQFIQELSKYTAIDVYSHLSEVMSRIKSGTTSEAFKQRGLQLIDLKVGSTTLPFFDQLKEDPTYGLPLHIALQNGDVDKVLDITKTVESMRALGKSPGAGTVGAIFAMPQMMAAPPAYGMPPAYGAPYQQPPMYAPPPQTQQTQPKPEQAIKTPYEKLKELKSMLDEGLITKEEFENLKKEILVKI